MLESKALVCERIRKVGAVSEVGSRTRVRRGCRVRARRGGGGGLGLGKWESSFRCNISYRTDPYRMNTTIYSNV